MRDIISKPYVLGDLVEVSQGLAINAKTKHLLVENGIPLLRITDLINETTAQFVAAHLAPAKCIAEEGDIIYTRTGQVGLVFNNRKGVIHNNCFKVIPNKKFVDSDYLFWFLSQEKIKQHANDIASGSVQKDLNHSAFKSIPIDLPPLDYQKKIGPILNTLSRKIKINTKTNQTLEQIAQAIFKSWFVDFDPVKAKIAVLEAGGTFDQAELAAMSAISAKDETALKQLQAEQPAAYAELAQTAALFPSKMVDSELGEIPEGWEPKPYGELLKKTIGGDWGKEEPDTKHTVKVKILRGTDLPNVHAGADSGVPTRYVEQKKLKTRQLQDGDIVIEVSGGSPTQPTGRSLYVTQNILDRLIEPSEPASFCRLFRPLDAKIGLYLSLHLSKIYSDGKTWLYQNQSTGISNFQTTVFLEKEIVVLPDEVAINAFYDQVRPLLNKIHNSENNKLSILRDTLLPKLLSGELPMPTTNEVGA